MQIGLKTLALIAVVIMAIVAYFALSGGPSTLSTMSTVTLSKNGSYSFYLSGDQNASSILLTSTSALNATVYLGRRPLLLGNILELHLSPGKSDNVSLTGSRTADLNVLLTSSTSSSATLTLTYVPSGFGVAVTPGIKTINLVSSSSGQSSQSSTSTIQSTNSGSSTSVRTTTIAATTTSSVNSSLNALQQVNASSVGTMVTGYSNLFKRQFQSCTLKTYNNEFASQYGMVPSGPQTFANESLQVPQKIIGSVKGVGNALYNITYTEVATSGNRKFGGIQYNLTGQFITTSIFNGDFGRSYSAVLENYTTLNSSTDTCAVFGV